MKAMDCCATTSPLLGSDELPAVELVNVGGSSHVVLVCDHASNRVPRCLQNLGLDENELKEHIGWDPGAADVARRLAVHLDASLVLSGYSRLVVDCNRPLHSAESAIEQSAGIPIPGNRGLSPADKKRRLDALFVPYHDAISRLLDGRGKRPTVLLSVHSFTPFLNGRSRPWHVGISHGRNRQFAALMLEALGRNKEIIVGDNEPYPIEDEFDYTLPMHGDARGLPCAMIEIRQDGIQTAEGAAVWAARLAAAYRSIEEDALKLHVPSPEQ